MRDRILGKNYQKTLTILEDYIDVNHSYSHSGAARFSKSYRLKSRYRNALPSIYRVQTPFMDREVRQEPDRAMKIAACHKHGQVNWLNSELLAFDLQSAQKAATNLRERHFCKLIEAGRHRFYSVCDQGRHYHFIACMPSQFRRFLVHPDDDLVILDYRHCHASLHVTLYREGDGKEREDYIALCRAGELWATLNRQLGRPYDLTNPEEKATFKSECFAQVYYRKLESRVGPLGNAFRRLFPVLWERISEAKAEDSAALPCDMMRLEASIVVDRVLSRDYFCVSIHDAILTTVSDADEVTRRMKSEFEKKVGFVPVIDRKSLAINQAERTLVA